MAIKNLFYDLELRKRLVHCCREANQFLLAEDLHANPESIMKYYQKTVTSILFVIGFSTQLKSAESLRIVDDGETKAVIVISQNASGAAKFGATILKEHIFQISGAELNIVPEKALKPDNSKIRLLVGKSELTQKLGIKADELAPGEILIRTFPNAVVLLGADDVTTNDAKGSQFAVTTFLEDTLGVRYLWPGELGKVVPKRRTIDVSEISYRFAPILKQRKIRMAGTAYGDRMEKGGDQLSIEKSLFVKTHLASKKTDSADGGWGTWHHMGGSLRLAAGHSFGDIWERFGKEHPEWFAMAPNGSRDQSNSPHRARLCVSNPKLIAQIARDRIARINETGQKSVSIGPNDGGTTSFCMCEECKKLDPPEGRKITLIDFSPGANREKFEYVSMTDRYVHFFNAIAEQVTKVHPDVWLAADAYSVYAAPPVKAKLHPNIAIRYVGISYTDEEKRKQGIADWNAWSKAAKKIYFRSNMLLAGRRQGTPVIYVHKLSKDFSQIAKNNMIGTDLDSCLNHWATQGLNFYVMAKLLWNPDTDVDVLIDDYCTAGFGKGADAVKRYYLRLEELTNEMAEQGKKPTEPFTPEVVAELRGMLDEAKAATQGDVDTSKRVAFLRVGLEYTDAYCEIFRINREWEATGSKRYSKEFLERIGKACDRNREVSRDVFENNHLAINTTYVAWGSWAYFGRFGWNSSSDKLKK